MKRPRPPTGRSRDPRRYPSLKGRSLFTERRRRPGSVVTTIPRRTGNISSRGLDPPYAYTDQYGSSLRNVGSMSRDSFGGRGTEGLHPLDPSGRAQEENARDTKSVLMLTLDKLDASRLDSFHSARAFDPIEVEPVVRDPRRVLPDTPEESETRVGEADVDVGEEEGEVIDAQLSRRESPSFQRRALTGLENPLPNDSGRAKRRSKKDRDRGSPPAGYDRRTSNVSFSSTAGANLFPRTSTSSNGPLSRSDFGGRRIGIALGRSVVDLERENVLLKQVLTKRDGVISKLRMNMRLMENNFDLMETQISKLKEEKAQMERLVRRGGRVDVDARLESSRDLLEMSSGGAHDPSVAVSVEFDDVFVTIGEDRQSLGSYLERLDLESGTSPDD